MKPLINQESISNCTAGDLNILVSRTSLRDSTLYFHGFPGPYEPSQQGESRIVDDLYEIITERNNFYYPLYSIKQSGFSFIESVEDGTQALSFLRSGHPDGDLTIVGQSWGAVIALNLALKFRPKKLVLIVPFLFLPTGLAAERMVQNYSKMYPGLLPPENVLDFAKQIDFLASNCSPLDALRTIESEVIIIAAENDEVVSFEKVKAATCDLAEKIQLHRLDGQTHSVENRDQLKGVLKNAFAQI